MLTMLESIVSDATRNNIFVAITMISAGVSALMLLWVKFDFKEKKMNLPTIATVGLIFWGLVLLIAGSLAMAGITSKQKALKAGIQTYYSYVVQDLRNDAEHFNFKSAALWQKSIDITNPDTLDAVLASVPEEYQQHIQYDRQFHQDMIGEMMKAEPGNYDLNKKIFQVNPREAESYRAHAVMYVMQNEIKRQADLDAESAIFNLLSKVDKDWLVSQLDSMHISSKNYMTENVDQLSIAGISSVPLYTYDETGAKLLDQLKQQHPNIYEDVENGIRVAEFNSKPH